MTLQFGGVQEDHGQDPDLDARAMGVRRGGGPDGGSALVAHPVVGGGAAVAAQRHAHRLPLPRERHLLLPHGGRILRVVGRRQACVV